MNFVKFPEQVVLKKNSAWPLLKINATQMTHIPNVSFKDNTSAAFGEFYFEVIILFISQNNLSKLKRK